MKKRYRLQNTKGLLAEIRKGRAGYLFLLPLFLGLLLFSYFPPASGIYHSFFDWNGVGEKSFLGLDNYRKLLGDKVFLPSIVTLFKIMLPRLVISILAPLIMAELIYCTRPGRLQAFYRVAVLLPIVAPGVVGLLIWKNIFDPLSGLLTTLVRTFGLLPAGAVADWLGDPRLVIFSIIFMGFPWVGGTSVLIYMSGLMNISTEVTDAARLDGASALQRILKIDIPLLSGQLRYFLIFGIIGGLQDYGTQIVLTSGGPGYATMVPGYYMYTQAFTAGNMGYACCIGTVMFGAILLFTSAAFRLLDRKKGD